MSPGRALALAALTLAASAAPVARAGAQATPPGLPASRVSGIRDAVRDTMARLGIPGLSLAVVDGGVVRLQEARGFADVENGVPAPPESVYRLASVSKPMTAVALLHLYERRLIDLDAPVWRYCPEFPEKPSTGGKPGTPAVRSGSARSCTSTWTGASLAEDGLSRSSRTSRRSSLSSWGSRGAWPTSSPNESHCPWALAVTSDSSTQSADPLACSRVAAGQSCECPNCCRGDTPLRRDGHARSRSLEWPAPSNRENRCFRPFAADARNKAATAHVLHFQGVGGVEAVMSGRRASTYMGVAVLGGVVGAVVGLLLAPGAGDETRRRIARHSIEDQERLLRLAEMGSDSDLLGDDSDLPASA